jgi:outer membrane protein assembly factor BamB
MGLATLAAAVLAAAASASTVSSADPVTRPAAPPATAASDPLFGVVWRKSLVEAGLLEYRPFEPAGPVVDPVTRMVVVGTRDGHVHAFNPDGTLLWYYVGQAPYLAPPAVADDLVYVGGTDGKILALARATGEVRWKREYREVMGSQPLVDGGIVYVATLEGTVIALDAATGEWRWHFRREPIGKFTILGTGRPAVRDGVLYHGLSDGSVVALDARTGAVKWERRIGRGDYPDVDASVQLGRDRVFVASYGGQVAALDAATGATVWEAKVPYAYKLGMTGDLLHAVTTTAVVGLSARDGKELWSTPLEGMPFGEPVVAKGLLLVPATRGLLVLDARSGRKLRFFTRGTGATGSPAVSGDRVYVLSNAGELVAVDLR